MDNFVVATEIALGARQREDHSGLGEWYVINAFGEIITL